MALTQPRHSARQGPLPLPDNPFWVTQVRIGPQAAPPADAAPNDELASLRQRRAAIAEEAEKLDARIAEIELARGSA